MRVADEVSLDVLVGDVVQGGVVVVRGRGRHRHGLVHAGGVGVNSVPAAAGAFPVGGGEGHEAGADRCQHDRLRGAASEASRVRIL